jgi:transcription initiation factor TFIIIB Brf1 subunit/transcription initiation factor TFIIB
MFGTPFAFDCPKCKQEMVEKDDTATCMKCGFSAEIKRIKIYNEPKVEEEVRITEEEKERILKKLDENLIKDISKVNKDAEYNQKVERIKELKKRIEWLEGELRIVEDEMKKIDWERSAITRTLPTNLSFRYAGLKGRKESIKEWIRRYEFEIETIRRSL